MKVKTNLLIDLGIFAALLLALEPGLTGIPIHEWFSAAFAGAIIVHLLLHWNWIVTVMVKFFKKLFHVSRLQFVLDIVLFVAMTAVMMSGILISKTILPALGLKAARNPMMQGLHSLSANATLLLVGVHFALNWNWVVNAVRRVIVAPLESLTRKNQQPIPVTLVAASDHE
jgi:hypothetical protein